MRVLVYSDVHGNLPAFEKMLAVAPPFDTTICLGDLVNYGPWSNECVDLALSLPHLAMIMGNHEEAFLAGAYPGNNPLVQEFFTTCYKNFDRFKEIEKFRRQFELNPFIFVHTIENRNIYPDTDIVLTDNFVIGHSHHQFCLQQQEYVLYNAGSVGQNRGLIDVVNYLVFDTDTGGMEMCETVYDVNLLLNRMRQQGYSEACISYYENKKRKSNASDL